MSSWEEGTSVSEDLGHKPELLTSLICEAQCYPSPTPSTPLKETNKSEMQRKEEFSPAPYGLMKKRIRRSSVLAGSP